MDSFPVIGAPDAGDTAWMLASAALVLLMTPGLAFFYGGMVRSKNVLGMLMQNYFAMGLVGVLWVLVGFSLAFGNPGDKGFIGNFDHIGFADVHMDAGPEFFALTIPSEKKFCMSMPSTFLARTMPP